MKRGNMPIGKKHLVDLLTFIAVVIGIIVIVWLVIGMTGCEK